MAGLSRRLRRVRLILVHAALIAAANELAFLLRFDGDVPAWAQALQLLMLPWLIVGRGALFAPFGLYRGLWRYAGIWDLRNIVLSVGLSSGIVLAVIQLDPRLSAYPRSVVLIDALVLTCLLGGLRLLGRLHRARHLGTGKRAAPGRKVIIFGAGEAGESIVRDVRHHALQDYSPIGFVDDDLAKVGQSIHGVPVLGTRSDLPRIMAEQHPDELLIAMPAAESSTVRSIVRALDPYKVRITILPNLRDILDGTVSVSQIRKLAIEDLLPRAPVGIDDTPLRHALAGRRVMVTGAAGSIGSELCHQIMALKPETLVLYERSENGLYAISNALMDNGSAAAVRPVLGDITDIECLERTLEQFRPEVIFHAAAHKHVPLMEAHPCEAVKNNVAGTRLVAAAAKNHGVSRFILISTDKAVNPTSVMGATKRIAERVVMNEGRDGSTVFLTVRFGNVLGSNGSVVPRFLQQIEAGGPVTITHPAMRRYFMLIPEAVQLVLHVAGRGRDQSVYVLDMGEQILVEEMARNLIRMSGYVPDEDIGITYVGLRPGEKLFEELVGSSETATQSSIEKVFEVTPHDQPAPDLLDAQVRRLEWLARHGDSTNVLRMLSLMIPEYTGRSWDPIPDVPAAIARSRPVHATTEPVTV